MTIILYGLISVLVLLVPSIAGRRRGKRGSYQYAQSHLDTLAKIGSLGSIFFMIFAIDYTYLGPWFPFASELYLILNATLLFAYLVAWFVTAERDTLGRAVALSVIPASLYFVSGFLLFSIPLLVSSLLYAAGYIPLCIRNYRFRMRQNAAKGNEQ